LLEKKGPNCPYVVACVGGNAAGALLPLFKQACGEVEQP